MTLLVGNISQDFIALGVDSTFTNTFTLHPHEFETGKKAHPLPGIGIVTSWGLRNEKIWQHLRACDLTPKQNSIEDVKDCVWEFLTNILKPHENDTDEVGYYVLGFKPDFNPCFYHIRWGFSSRNPNPGDTKDYHIHQREEELLEGITYTYDGKFFAAHGIFNTLFDDIKAGGVTRYDTLSLVGRVQINDFILRFASEITKEVGPPFRHFMINQHNKIETLVNKSLHPLNAKSINRKLQKIRILRLHFD